MPCLLATLAAVGCGPTPAEMKWQRDQRHVLVMELSKAEAREAGLRAQLREEQSKHVAALRRAQACSSGASDAEPAAAPSHDPRRAATYSGRGTLNTSPFASDQPFELVWTSEAAIHVALYTESGEIVAVVADQPSAGRGSSFWPRPGRYFLQVIAAGSWALAVVKTD